MVQGKIHQKYLKVKYGYGFWESFQRPRMEVKHYPGSENWDSRQLSISLADMETEQTCGSICLLRLKLLKREIKSRGSAHTPSKFPFKKILSLPEISCREISSSFFIPQETNVLINGFLTTELTTAVTARFFTNPHFSPSGVDKKHSFPQ